MGLERRKAGGPLPGQELLGSTEPVLTTGPAGMPAPNLVTTDANLKQEELIPAISPHPCWFSQGQSQLSSWGHGHLGGGLGAPGPRQGQWAWAESREEDNRRYRGCTGWKTRPCPIAELSIWAAGPSGSDPAGQRRWGA